MENIPHEIPKHFPMTLLEAVNIVRNVIAIPEKIYHTLAQLNALFQWIFIRSCTHKTGTTYTSPFKTT